MWGKLKNIVLRAKEPNSLVLVLLSVITSFFVPSLAPIVLKKFNIEALSNEHIFIMTVSVLLVTLIIVLPIFCLIILVKYNRQELTNDLYRLATQLKDNLINVDNNNKELTTELCTMTTQLQNSLCNWKGIIDTCPGMNEEINLVIRSHTLPNGIYGHLIKAREKIKNSSETIYLTNFSKMSGHIMNSEQNEEEKYFKYEMEFFYKNQTVKAYKIVTIHTKEKFKYCKDLVDKATGKNLSNFHLAYLYIDYNEGKLPKVINVQVIDDEVILMDPKNLSTKDNIDSDSPIYIKSQVLAELFASYYKKMWEEIRESSEDDGKIKEGYSGYCGYILYDGRPKRLESKYWKNINNAIGEEQFTKDELDELLKTNDKVDKK